MPFILILIAAVFLVSAFNNTQGNLATALEQDVPGYTKWAAALAAVGALGWVPGLQKPSRYLLALVLLVIFLRNYQNILNGFKAAAGGVAPQASQPTPAQAYISSGGGAVPVSSINPTGGTTSTTPLYSLPSWTPPATIGTGTTSTSTGQVSFLGTGGSSSTTGYAETSSGTLVPVEYTGNVNSFGSGTAVDSAGLPFGSFDPGLFGGTALDSGFGGVA